MKQRKRIQLQKWLHENLYATKKTLAKKVDLTNRDSEATIISMNQILLSSVFYLTVIACIGCGGETTAENKILPGNAEMSSDSTPIPKIKGANGSIANLNNTVDDTLSESNSVTSSHSDIGSEQVEASLNGESSTSSSNDLRTGVSTLRGEISDLNKAMNSLGAKVVGNEIVVELPSDILFDFDKYSIRPDAVSALEKLLILISAQNSGAVRIEGHTDSIASNEYNQTLSERRAESVKNWLVERRVSNERLTTRGFGESRPKVPNTKPDGSDDPRGRQKNRRVGIFIKKG